MKNVASLKIQQIEKLKLEIYIIEDLNINYQKELKS